MILKKKKLKEEKRSCCFWQKFALKRYVMETIRVVITKKVLTMRKSFSTPDLFRGNNNDFEIKLSHNQIANAEKSIANLIRDFTNISVDMHRLESRYIDLCNTLNDLAAFESPMFSRCLKGVCKHLHDTVRALKDHTEVIQNKVILHLSENIDDCDTTRHYLKKYTGEKTKRKENTSESLVITQQMDELNKKMEHFEKGKIDCLHTCFKRFIHSSLAYHIKGVENMTEAYKALAQLNKYDHLDYMNKKLLPSADKVRLEFVCRNSIRR
ncbi:uncharacterized protein LOC101238782 isoform X1 [Hydra vulgaris]|uniref:uncharacterized protein LOC101238782 isoform X1 n=1 Tax=Hydra vulgaris TaxID=6087 RepID=UPI001F5FE04C|nr:uncharacterized protein LOC101238782 isoform X1 [Hydra vulgaris]